MRAADIFRKRTLTGLHAFLLHDDMMRGLPKWNALMLLIIAPAILLSIYNVFVFSGPEMISSNDKLLLKKKKKAFQQQSSTGKKTSTTRQDTPSEPKLKYHLIVSTGCNAFQDWQSYVFFHQVWKSGQKGEVTRIASGCKDEEQEELLRKTFREQIAPMSPNNFKLHITPDYSRIVPGLTFKYFNKCFGVQHWIRNELKMPNPVHNDTIFVLLDPDQLVVRPFDDNYENEEWHKDRGYRAVAHGQPIAQFYGIGARFWSKIHRNTSLIVGGDRESKPSPLWDTQPNDLLDYYISGPPYMFTGFDMVRLVDTWAEFNPPVKALTERNDILSEMKAFILASVHLNLPHQIGKSYMVSAVNNFQTEGWKSVSKMKDVCAPIDETEIELMPHTIHFCQGYFSSRWFFSKYAVPDDIITCEHPLLAEPNADLRVNKHRTAITPYGKMHDLDETAAVQNAFMLCQIIPRVNAALEYFKQNHCGADANFNKTYDFQKKDSRFDIPKRGRPLSKEEYEAKLKRKSTGK